jgi:hypothetical protein
MKYDEHTKDVLMSTDHHAFIQKKMDYLSFHLTSCSRDDMVNLQKMFFDLVCFVDEKMRSCSSYSIYLQSLYNIVCFTRDCNIGKGLRDVSYMMICCLYTRFPHMAFHLIYMLPYIGSWADIKYLCGFVRGFCGLDFDFDPLITCAVDVLVYQFNSDYVRWNEAFDNYLLNKSAVCVIDGRKRPRARDFISFAAKWIPREKNKYGWLFDIVVERYFTIFEPFVSLSVRKMKFRKMVSTLSRELDVLERKMCTLNWASIDCKNVSLGSFLKCQSALLHGRSYYTNAVDRDLCREFMLDALSCDNDCSGSASGFSKKLNINMGKLVSLGFDLIKKPYNQTVMSQMSFVNNIWKKIVGKHDKAHSLLPILDSSIDIDKHAWFDMLGMCLLFARVSTLKRILVFRNNECVTMTVDEKADFTDLLRAFVDFETSVYVDFNACLQNLYRGFHYLNTHVKLIYVSTSSRILDSVKTFDCFSHKHVGYVFWNVQTYGFDECSFEHFEPVRDQGVVFLSGSTPNLLSMFS